MSWINNLTYVSSMFLTCCIIDALGDALCLLQYNYLSFEFLVSQADAYEIIMSCPNMNTKKIHYLLIFLTTYLKENEFTYDHSQKYMNLNNSQSQKMKIKSQTR